MPICSRSRMRAQFSGGRNDFLGGAPCCGMRPMPGCMRGCPACPGANSGMFAPPYICGMDAGTDCPACGMSGCMGPGCGVPGCDRLSGVCAPRGDICGVPPCDCGEWMLRGDCAAPCWHGEATACCGGTERGDARGDGIEWGLGRVPGDCTDRGDMFGCPAPGPG